MRLGKDHLDKRSRLELIFLSLPVTLLLAAASNIFAGFIGAAQGFTRIILIIPFALCGLLISLGAWMRQSRVGGYKRTARRLARAVTGAGLPVLIALGEVCRADSQTVSVQLMTLRNRILDTSRRICGVKNTDQTRVSLYELTKDGDLTLTLWLGDRGSPRTAIRNSDIPLGRALTQFAQGPSDVDRVRDIHKQPTRLGPVDASQATYQSYVAVPVAVDGRGYGLLFVDSACREAFTEADEGTLLLLAGALAAGLAHADRLCNPLGKSA